MASSFPSSSSDAKRRLAQLRERNEAFPPNERLARAIADGLGLRFSLDLGDDARRELRDLAQEIRYRLGRRPDA